VKRVLRSAPRARRSSIAQRLVAIEMRLTAIERKLNDPKPAHGQRRRHRRVIPS
jgi:hypothetical protein